jgi:hypothetical protein
MKLNTLTIISNNKTYTAAETLRSVAQLMKSFKIMTGFFTGNNVEVKTYYTDPANETNYYLYKYNYSNQGDKILCRWRYFFQGNKFQCITKWWFKIGDEITVTHYGI